MSFSKLSKLKYILYTQTLFKFWFFGILNINNRDFSNNLNPIQIKIVFIFNI